mmetsp:Transcript_34952/g.76907  ORF Transcript_34952/g.76907 Transcript_34952/m.76907 type:complete len:240 (-) Transcript_34952:434-1153(-)
MVRTIPCTRVGLRARPAPQPRLHTTSMGHPMLMSMKSTSHVSSISCAARPIAATAFPASCTPKTSSHLWRRSSAHSDDCAWSRLVAMAISPHVMSTPKSLHTRRNGRLPTVVSGARYVLPRKSTFLRSRAWISGLVLPLSSLASISLVLALPSGAVVSAMSSARPTRARSRSSCCCSWMSASTRSAMLSALAKSYWCLRNLFGSSRGSSFVSQTSPSDSGGMFDEPWVPLNRQVGPKRQ